MPDWTKSMTRTYEYYIVDPNTWKDDKKINTITDASISRDEGADTLGSANISATDIFGECYVRIYLVTIQNGLQERHPLGTYLLQTPASRFDGKKTDVSIDAYTPLIELREKHPPIGFSLLEGENILERAYQIIRENARAPVVKTLCDTTLNTNFVSDINEKWTSFLIDLLSNANYNLDLDEMGRILFSPRQELESLQPIWTFNDDNSSILYPDLSIDHDLYGIPNVVEISYSKGKEHYFSRVVNDDSNSPTSTVNRGREIIYRDDNPSIIGIPTQRHVDQHAEKLLKSLSTLEYTVSYSHGYCPVRVGDCVRLNYERAGLIDIKARVISQTINCDSECKVSEKAVFTKKFWR